jgi:hypothetical protein
MQYNILLIMNKNSILIRSYRPVLVHLCTGNI